MLYLDTSVAVPLFVTEPNSESTVHWLRGQADRKFAISQWTVTEFACALSLKQREGRLTERQRMAALAEFRRTAEASFISAPIAPHHFAMAAGYCTRADLNIRASDALHLAIAIDNGMTLVSRDRRLVTAAEGAGAFSVLLA